MNDIKIPQEEVGAYDYSKDHNSEFVDIPPSFPYVKISDMISVNIVHYCLTINKELISIGI